MIKQVIEMPVELAAKIEAMCEAVTHITKAPINGPWLNVDEAAKYIDRSPKYLKTHLKDQIGFSRPGKDILFHIDDLDRYLRMHYTPAKT